MTACPECRESLVVEIWHPEEHSSVYALACGCGVRAASADRGAIEAKMPAKPPPAGCPDWLAEELWESPGQRCRDLAAALDRFEQAGRTPSEAWEAELGELVGEKIAPG